MLARILTTLEEVTIHRGTSLWEVPTIARIAALSGAGSLAQALTTCASSGQTETLLCVPSCVPASGFPCEIWRREGDSNPTIVPANKGESHDDSRIDSRNQIPFCPDLARVVTVWPKLPMPLRTAILAIVDSTASSDDKAP